MSKEDKVADAVVAERKEKKDKKDKKDKKEKKEHKEKKRSETDGVHKSKDKSEKKEKKHKKDKLAKAVEAHLDAEEAAKSTDAAKDETASKKTPRAAKPIVRGALVPFALPLADEKYQKKVFRLVKRAAQNQSLLRGVKEVNKALRKAPAKNPSATSSSVPGIVIIAADVNPAEVVMHLPVACEDVNAPYVFVLSRGELGQAARTKRPTSVVMIKAEGRKGGKASSAAAAADDDDEEDEGSYADQYQELLKLAQAEFAKQLKGII